MEPTARAEINRENASHSTGAKTEEGKQRSKWNARRHNLTGQTIIGTEEEMAIYASKCETLRADLRPEGAFETSLVQSLADSQFQLDRARAIETNMFFELSIQHLPVHSPASDYEDPQHPSHPDYSPARQGGDSQHPTYSPARQGGDTTYPSPSPARNAEDPDATDPVLDWARAQAKAFIENGKHFDLIGRYANRFHRQVLQLHATLVKVQKERRAYDQHRNEQRKQRQAEALAQHQNQSTSRTHHSPKSSSTGLPACESKTATGFVSQNPQTTLNPERKGRDQTPKTLGEIALANLKNQAA